MKHVFVNSESRGEAWVGICANAEVAFPNATAAFVRLLNLFLYEDSRLPLHAREYCALDKVAL